MTIVSLLSAALSSFLTIHDIFEFFILSKLLQCGTNSSFQSLWSLETKKSKGVNICKIVVGSKAFCCFS